MVSWAVQTRSIHPSIHPASHHQHHQLVTPAFFSSQAKWNQKHLFTLLLPTQFLLSSFFLVDQKKPTDDEDDDKTRRPVPWVQFDAWHAPGRTDGRICCSTSLLCVHSNENICVLEAQYYIHVSVVRIHRFDRFCVSFFLSFFLFLHLLFRLLQFFFSLRTLLFRFHTVFYVSHVYLAKSLDSVLNDCRRWKERKGRGPPRRRQSRMSVNCVSQPPFYPIFFFFFRLIQVSCLVWGVGKKLSKTSHFTLCIQWNWIIQRQTRLFLSRRRRRHSPVLAPLTSLGARNNLLTKLARLM